VGSGTGKVLKSVGQGAGQAVGGCTLHALLSMCDARLKSHSSLSAHAVAGGLLLVGKGIGKGITSGDGRAVASGLAEGTAAIGSGVGQGLESVVTGTADGVLSVGQGIFSGVRSVGKGIGGALTGKNAKRKPSS
jgi:hypothetical protein